MRVIPRLVWLVVWQFCICAWSQDKTLPDVRVLEVLFEAKVVEQVTNPHMEAMKDLRSKYAAALTRSLEAAQDEGKLEDALAFKSEKELIDRGEEVAVKDEASTPESLKKFRATYRSSAENLDRDRKNRFQALAAAHAKELTDLSIKLTKAGKLEEARTAKEKADAIGVGTQPTSEPAPPSEAVKFVEEQANEKFSRQIAGTSWKWNGGSNVLTFGKDGKVQMQDWERKGLATEWKVIKPGRVELRIAEGRTTQLTATLVFGANRKSFGGMDFDGKSLNDSPRLK